MNQLSNNGMHKAITGLSVMTLFAFGCISTQFANTAFAQEKPISGQAAHIESPEDKAMELPGIFKVMPDRNVNLTQKSSNTASRKRSSEAQFTADLNKGMFGANLKRSDRRSAQAVARGVETRDAKTIVIPPRIDNWDALSVDSFDRGNASDFHATAYCLKGRTASGEYVRQGFVAADPRVLPLGTLVHIEAGRYTGVYKVADTGGAIRGNKIDIYVPSYHEAKLFGRQKIRVKVLSRRK